jgi:hypothetical protein
MPNSSPELALAGRYLIARSALAHVEFNAGFQQEQSTTICADASDGNATASSDVTSPTRPMGNLAHGPDMFRRAGVIGAGLDAGSIRVHQEAIMVVFIGSTCRSAKRRCAWAAGRLATAN